MNHTDKHVVLIGFMGSGKSTIGQFVATELGMPLYDCDQQIQTLAGMRIPDIFESQGEAAFRAIELRALQSLMSSKPGVITTGGGIVSTSDGIAMLKRADIFVVWLQVSFETAHERAQADSDNVRPLFADAASARQLFTQRQQWYDEAATVTIDANQSVKDVYADVLKVLAT